MGLDSIFDISISRREKHANALYSAPGLFGNTNRMDVLDAILGGRRELTGRRERSKKRVKLLSSSSNSVRCEV